MVGTAFCDNSACPTFQVAKYLRDLRRYLPAVPPISTNQLRALHASRDYKGMVRLIKYAMNIETDIRVVWVSEGEAEDAKIKHAPAWIRLPSEMPPYGSEAFRQLRIDIFLRRSFLEQSAFDEVSIGIAHELSHLVLDSIKHPLRRCEKAVDLTAMMLGFRCLFATGTYKEIQIQNRIEIRQQGYLNPDEVRQAECIIHDYQDTPRRTQPQTEETIDWIRQVRHRLAQLRYAIARFDFREHFMSKWRPSTLALLSILFIVIASWIVWANGLLPLVEASRRSADQTAVNNLPLSETAPPSQQLQTSKTGETVDQVRQVQVRLAQLGYLVGKPEGRWGPKSRAALKSFKKTNGLIVNDLLDSATLSALFSSSAGAASIATVAKSRK
jgi:Putative peptidoglycan binding domain